jgi:hypothetical protein
MRKLTLSVVAVMLLAMSVVCLTGNPAEAQPKSYPMVCKGGGQMDMGYWKVKGFAIFFSKGSRAASAGQPVDGTCAWMDRPVGPKEPSELWVPRAKLDVIKTSRGRVKYMRILGGRGINTMIKSVLDKKVFYVHVFKNRNGKLEISRFGP